MSDSSSSNKIVIKFEVHVPMTGGAPGVAVSQGGVSPEPCPAADQLLPNAPMAPKGPGSLSIKEIAQLVVGESPIATAGVSLPVGNAFVKVTTNGKTICVTQNGDSSSVLGIPSDVYVKVQPPEAPVPAIVWNTETPSGFRAEPVGVGGSFFQWRHLAVPNVECAAPGTGVSLPANRLLVWRKFDNLPFWTRESVIFYGECSDKTDCDDRLAAPMYGASSTVETAPMAMCAIVQGFSDRWYAFNGRWLLVRQPEASRGLAWSCGGDGHSQPRFELRGDTCGCEPLVLRLSYAGTQVEYSLARSEFNPLGTNRFVRCDSSALPARRDAPIEVSIVPA